jgi:hypothetical protein
MARRRSPWDIPPVKIPKWEPSRYGLMDDAIREDERQRRREIAEDVSRSTIIANREIAANARSERIAREQQLQREEDERYWNSPEGIRQRQKENDRSIHLRKKIITFFWSRPINLIQNWFQSKSNYVDYKNYVSISVWIAWIIIPIVYGLFLFPAVLFGSIFLMCIFYFLQFEIKYFINR